MHVILSKNATLHGIEPVLERRLPGEVPLVMRERFEWYAAGRLRPEVTEAAGRVVLVTGEGV
jgi:hypothetical protein